jgi:hypothetical protein
MKERLQIAIVVVLVAAAAAGYVVFDRWVTRTGGRSATDLAAADACVNWAHADDATRARTDSEIIAKCQIYFRNRTTVEANADDDRWRARSAQ